MPRPRRAQDRPNSMVASAAAVTRSRLRPVGGRTITDWQEEAWYFYDAVGEFTFAVTYISHALSRCRLKIVRDDPLLGEVDVTPEDTTPGADVALAALDALCGGVAGQEQMLAQLGVHMSVPGEAYLVGFPADEQSPRDRWEVLSTVECFREGNKWVIDRGDIEQGRREYADDDDTAPLVIRIWRPHPRQWAQATSPARAALPILRELEELTKHVAATVDSRLAGAGVLFVPSEMTFAPQGPQDEQNIPDPTQDPFTVALTETMVTAIKDRGNAAAVAPIVAKVPGQFINGIKHITFSTPFDAQSLALREEAIRRLALSWDMPPEVLLGQSDSNHWTGWLISEDTLKIHVAPVYGLITGALTERFLWPVMEGRTSDPALVNRDASAEVSVFRIAADDTELRIRPDLSEAAQDAWDRMTLSTKAYLEARGFDEADQPDAQEMTERLLIAAARANIPPAVALAAMQQLGVPGLPDSVEVTGAPGDSSQALPGPGAGTAPDDNRSIPEEQAAALQAASELLLARTIERARNRLGRRSSGPRAYPVDRVTEALAADPMDCQRVSNLLGVDAPRLHGALMAYAQVCLIEGKDIQAHEVRDVITTAVLPPTLRAVTGG